jgi:hypothetical protein
MKTYTVTLTTTATTLSQLLATAGYTVTTFDFSGTTKANLWTTTSDWQMTGSNDSSLLPVLVTQIMPIERVHDLLNLRLRVPTGTAPLYLMLM